MVNVTRGIFFMFIVALSAELIFAKEASDLGEYVPKGYVISELQARLGREENRRSFSFVYFF